MSDIVERLKAAELALRGDGIASAIKEIEWLREHHKIAVDNWTREHHKIAVDNWTLEAQTVKQQEDQIHEQNAEIERLRKDYTNIVRAAVNVAADATAFKAEIERLRGLLREAVMIDSGDFAVNVDEWMKRVREALR